MSFLDRFFGESYEKELKQIRPIVADINAHEAELEAFSDADLVAETRQLQQVLQGDGSIDEILPRAYALVRESARRVLGVRYYDVQMIGGIILHRGKITEMRTGEGKTFVGTLPAYLNALVGKGVHVVTVNDYLARRDAVWVGGVYTKLGLQVGVINQGQSYLYDDTHQGEVDSEDAETDRSVSVEYDCLRPCTRQEAYAADITYGTNNEYGFDYLRDNIEFKADALRQRAPYFAIIDEVDSVLIDEARTPLIISAPAADSENLYEIFARIANKLELETHFVIDEKLKSATLTDAGIEAAEKMLGIDNIYTDRGIKYVHHLETAVRAKAIYTKDKEYVVRDNEVVIVDEFTGRLQVGRRWSDGLHQAVEAKEGVSIQKESRTYASVTFQNYFKMYEKLAGMTGTGLTSQEEFFTVYGLDVIPVPTNKEVKRIDNADAIFGTSAGKYQAIIRKVKEVSETGQPILIGTASIDTNELLSMELTKAGVNHQMLNAKNHEQEGEIIADAGRKGAVTLATNMAGRGVDIKLGGMSATEAEAKEVLELGGLFVLGTERHDARRIDNQLRGRSGRQGDPGETQFYVSMEDELMRRFGGDRIKGMLDRLNYPADQPIQSKMITNSLESAQRRIEGFNFDARKQVLAYDNVLNQQRTVIYERRRNLLHDGEAEVEKIIAELITEVPDATEAIERKREELGEETWTPLMQRLCLQVIDTLWVEHLEVMDYARSSVSLRSYGQRDPLTEYKKEGVRLFKELEGTILYRLADLIPNLAPQVVEREEEQLRKQQAAAQRTGGSDTAHTAEPKQAVSKKTYGRNDTVTISDGTDTKTMKYKKAEALLSQGWQIVTT